MPTRTRLSFLRLRRRNVARRFAWRAAEHSRTVIARFAAWFPRHAGLLDTFESRPPNGIRGARLRCAAFLDLVKRRDPRPITFVSACATTPVPITTPIFVPISIPTSIPAPVPISTTIRVSVPVPVAYTTAISVPIATSFVPVPIPTPFVPVPITATILVPVPVSTTIPVTTTVPAAILVVAARPVVA